MEIKILFDNRRLNRTFIAGWGLSYLVDDRILFDTGESAGPLFYNMDRMGVSIEQIQSVVISHEHFDHTGGLWNILKERPGINVYVCPDFSAPFKEEAASYTCNVIEAHHMTPIAERIQATGQLRSGTHSDGIAEQSLVLCTELGLTMLTGCAHVGIVDMVEQVTMVTGKKSYLVMGGFHLLGEPETMVQAVGRRLHELGVQYIGPAHCTGTEPMRILKGSYGQRFIDVLVGETIKV